MNFKAQATYDLMAQYLYEAYYNPTICHIYKLDVSWEIINSVLRGLQKDVWNKIFSNKWGQLAQDNAYGVHSTDTIDFISKSDVPLGQFTTYTSFVLDYCPLKLEPNRVKMTVGGDVLYNAEDSDSPTASMLETIF